jgi:hypothetical protein
MIFGFLAQNLETKAVAVAFIMSWHEAGDGAARGTGLLAGFRGELYCSLVACQGDGTGLLPRERDRLAS